MTITQKELYDENKKPVLKEGEALTNGRMFPLEDGETGEGIGLTEKSSSACTTGHRRTRAL